MYQVPKWGKQSLWRMWKYTHNRLERQEENDYLVAAFFLSSLRKGKDYSGVVSVMVCGVMGRVPGPADQVTQGSWCCQL